MDRPHQNYIGAQYFLPCDEKERQRLNLQHKMFKRTFDNQLIIAPVVLRAGDRVLDSGTGSGIWIVDLLASGAVPDSVYLQGLDIEARLLPLDDPLIVSNWNVRFCIGSVVSLPPSWTASFTLIHQRLLIAALREAEWVCAFREFYRALVPGGWVQLCEAGRTHIDAAGPASMRMLALVKAMHDFRGLLIDCAQRIPAMLEAAGFVNLRVDIRKIELGKWAGTDGAEARDAVLGVFSSMKGPMMKAGGLGIVSSEEELDALLHDVEKEMDNTPGIHQNVHMICAQKPAEQTS